MQSNHKARVEALEKELNAAPVVCGIPQIVVYDPKTGEPLNTPDPSAIKQIWMADDGTGLELANAR